MRTTGFPSERAYATTSAVPPLPRAGSPSQTAMRTSEPSTVAIPQSRYASSREPFSVITRTCSAWSRIASTCVHSAGGKSLANSARGMGRMACQDMPSALACAMKSWSPPSATEESASHSPAILARRLPNASEMAWEIASASMTCRCPENPTTWNRGIWESGLMRGTSVTFRRLHLSTSRRRPRPWARARPYRLDRPARRATLRAPMSSTLSSNSSEGTVQGAPYS